MARKLKHQLVVPPLVDFNLHTWLSSYGKVKWAASKGRELGREGGSSTELPRLDCDCDICQVTQAKAELEEILRIIATVEEPGEGAVNQLGK